MPDSLISETTTQTYGDKLKKARFQSFLNFNIDCAFWLFVVIAAVIFRFEFDLSRVDWIPTIAFGVLAGVVHTVVGLFIGLYKGKYLYGSFLEVRALTIAVIIEALILTFIALVGQYPFNVPRSTVFIAFPLVLLCMFAVRYSLRLLEERAKKPKNGARPAIILGAGSAGDMIVRAMLTTPESPLMPVAICDDDPQKQKLVLHGIPVQGRTWELEQVAKKTGAEVVVFAIGSANSALLRKLTDIAVEAGLQVMVAPTMQELAGGNAQVSDIRNVSIEDLIGRTPVDTQVETIAGYITGNRVLVTGAGGSIGAELSLQISKYGPKELIMLDRDETGLQQAQLAIAGHGLLDTNDVVLADIREPDTLLKIFQDRKPEVVFHAAALKHLPMLEQYPDEAWKTNVLGTLNVVQAARAVGVHTFVNISTDKAANPTSALGHSKRVAEKITAWAGEDTGFKYLSVRFGNVIGSRGSMLPTFQALIAAGGPLTVTHPDVTRFFMTIPEACQLVIQAGGIGRPGEVLILDMGEPVRIMDVAQRMIAMSGKKIEIVFTGLRDGEKLHEELVGDKENLERPFHPMVSHARADSITPDRLDKDVWLRRMHEQNEQTLVNIDEPEEVK